MSYQHLAARLPETWRGEFLRFVKTGEASDSFLRHLDQDAATQKAVEEAFDAQAAAFKRLADHLGDSSGDDESTSEVRNRVQRASEHLVHGLTEIMGLPPRERRQAAKSTVDVLRREGHAGDARNLVTELEEDLEGAI